MLAEAKCRYPRDYLLLCPFIGLKHFALLYIDFVEHLVCRRLGQLQLLRERILVCANNAEGSIVRGLASAGMISSA